MGNMRTLENNKSPGEDIVSAELIKYGEKKLWEEIHALFEVIRASEKMPENWRTAIIRPYIRREIKCNVALIEESLY
jgi:gentisate 1,2-dioxygenase